MRQIRLKILKMEHQFVVVLEVWNKVNDCINNMDIGHFRSLDAANEFAGSLEFIRTFEYRDLSK